jgi:glycosyltransferase involved in cell wall biosynthesis
MTDRQESRASVDFLTPYLRGKSYHMPHSGYETLLNFVETPNIICMEDFPRITRLLHPLRLLRILPKSYSSLQAELAALKASGRILHHLYAEDTFWISSLRRKARRPIVATFHRPPRILNATMPFFWRRTARRLRGIVVLSPEQLAFLRSACGSAKTHVSLIPHGIDVDHFGFSQKDRSRDLVVAVGNYLRDYDTLIRAMRIVSGSAPRLRLVLVSVSAPRVSIGTPSVLPHVRISDEGLLGYYRQASFMVLPLASMAASNTMLEAMACGMPVICPGFESAFFYMGEDVPTTYEPGNPDDLAQKILWLYGEDKERRNLGLQMRRRAELFSWPKIWASLRDFYDLILES